MTDRITDHFRRVLGAVDDEHPLLVLATVIDGIDDRITSAFVENVRNSSAVNARLAALESRVLSDPTSAECAAISRTARAPGPVAADLADIIKRTQQILALYVTNGTPLVGDVTVTRDELLALCAAAERSAFDPDARSDAEHWKRRYDEAVVEQRKQERIASDLFDEAQTAKARVRELESAPATREPSPEQIAVCVVRTVCELSDLSSPDDESDLIQCTADELQTAVLCALESPADALKMPTPPAPREADPLRDISGASRDGATPESVQLTFRSEDAASAFIQTVYYRFAHPEAPQPDPTLGGTKDVQQ